MEAKGDDPGPATPTAASLLALVRDAATTDELTARLASLAAAVAGFQITVAKAEVLAAAKAKRAALGAGGWTKECAVALKGVLQAFGKGVSSVTSNAELVVGSIVIIRKPYVGSVAANRAVGGRHPLVCCVCPLLRPLLCVLCILL